MFVYDEEDVDTKSVLTGSPSSDLIDVSEFKSTSPKNKGVTINSGAGNDVINFKKSKYKNKLYGQNGNDTIYGGTKNDLIDGGSVFDFDTTKLSVFTRDIGLAGIEVYT